MFMSRIGPKHLFPLYWSLVQNSIPLYALSRSFLPPHPCRQVLLPQQPLHLLRLPPAPSSVTPLSPPPSTGSTTPGSSSPLPTNSSSKPHRRTKTPLFETPSSPSTHTRGSVSTTTLQCSSSPTSSTRTSLPPTTSRVFVRKKAIAVVLRVFDKYPDMVRVCFKRLVENPESFDLGLCPPWVGERVPLALCESTREDAISRIDNFTSPKSN
ncbi:hypothetical protein AAZX31_04G145700 [Glycine max]